MAAQNTFDGKLTYVITREEALNSKDEFAGGDVEDPVGVDVVRTRAIRAAHTDLAILVQVDGRRARRRVLVLLQLERLIRQAVHGQHAGRGRGAHVAPGRGGLL